MVPLNWSSFICFIVFHYVKNSVLHCAWTWSSTQSQVPVLILTDGRVRVEVSSQIFISVHRVRTKSIQIRIHCSKRQCPLVSNIQSQLHVIVQSPAFQGTRSGALAEMLQNCSFTSLNRYKTRASRSEEIIQIADVRDKLLRKSSEPMKYPIMQGRRAKS